MLYEKPIMVSFVLPVAVQHTGPRDKPDPKCRRLQALAPNSRKGVPCQPTVHRRTNWKPERTRNVYRENGNL